MQLNEAVSQLKDSLEKGVNGVGSQLGMSIKRGCIVLMIQPQ